MSVFDPTLTTETVLTVPSVDAIAFTGDGSHAWVASGYIYELWEATVSPPALVDLDGNSGNGITPMSANRVGQHLMVITPF